jgi:ADP-ribose pyrophosphatase
MKKAQPQSWKLIKTESGPDLHLFRVKYNWMKNPRNGREMRTVVLESSDWVNVVAVTMDRKIVTVSQYRFGIGDVTVEIPGGLVNPGEESLDAAKRELMEETGYTSSEWKYLGSVQPNPAFHNNLCHFWLATSAIKTEMTALDDGEDIAVSLLSLEDVRSAIREGRLKHSLTLSALSRIFNIWPKLDEYEFGVESQ